MSAAIQGPERGIIKEFLIYESKGVQISFG